MDRTWLSVQMEGRTHKDVAVVGMRAKVLSRGEPLRGTHISCPSAGDVSAIGIAFDLEELEPVARILQDDGSAGDPYFGSSAVTFSKGEVVPFQIVGVTGRSHVEWIIEADLLIDDQRDRPHRRPGRTLQDHGRTTPRGLRLHRPVGVV